jgi:hypothetical protein
MAETNQSSYPEANRLSEQNTERKVKKKKKERNHPSNRQ